VTDVDTDPFVSEIKYWRDVRGLSQAGLAGKMGYHRTYLSKIEGAQEPATRDVATKAEEVLTRCWPMTAATIRPPNVVNYSTGGTNRSPGTSFGFLLTDTRGHRNGRTTYTERTR
jgi:hypothetical protein